MPYLESNSEAFQNTALVLARRNPEQVLDWVETFPAGPARGRILDSSMNVFAFDDHVAAIKYFKESSEESQDQMIGGLLKGWILKDPEAPKESLNWLSNQELPETRKSELAGESISLASRKYPQAVIEILADSNMVALIAQKPGALEEIHQNVGAKFSQNDLAAGMKWIESFPNPESTSSQEGFKSFFRGWLIHDTDAAVTWSESLSSDELRKAGNAIMSEELEGE